MRNTSLLLLGELQVASLAHTAPHPRTSPDDLYLYGLLDRSISTTHTISNPPKPTF